MTVVKAKHKKREQSEKEAAPQYESLEKPSRRLEVGIGSAADSQLVSAFYIP